MFKTGGSVLANGVITSIDSNSYGWTRTIFIIVQLSSKPDSVNYRLDAKILGRDPRPRKGSI